MKNMLVTGGAGFIGSNFIRYLINQEPDIHIKNLDILTYAGSKENLRDIENSPRYTFIHNDILNQTLVEEIIAEHQIDTVVHFAAESHVDRSILGPAQFIETNVMGTFALLEAVRKKWLLEKRQDLKEVKFHHVSTDEVFGSLEPDDPAFSETTPYAPNSPYAASKASSDHLVRAYFHTYGLPVTITNCSNNYGPYQFPEKLIPLMVLNAMSGKPLPVYGDGKQVRDWLYVEDHCEAILQVLKRGKVGETYNIGGNNQPTNLEVVTTICTILDDVMPDSPHVPHQNLIQFVTDRPGHDRRYAMNIEKIQNELGWYPRQSLQSGMRKTVEWYNQHPEWIEAIQKKQEYSEWIDQNYAKRGVK